MELVCQKELLKECKYYYKKAFKRSGVISDRYSYEQWKKCHSELMGKRKDTIRAIKSI